VPLRLCLATLAALLMLAAGPALAQSVALTGTMGERALLVIDGAEPQVFAPGDTRQGVTLVSAGNDAAVIEILGQRQNLRVGESPVSLEHHGNGAQRIILRAGSGGHYFGTAMINGKTLPFMVDTGATSVVITASQADHIGLSYRSGARSAMATANGAVAAWHMPLDVIRIGDVEIYNVPADIVPNGTSFMLLGNSFLGRFRLTQENDQLIMEKRY
jgi:aspartyl protease family protein